MFNAQSSKVFGGTMLIAGTTIGAAMLAMPILTGLFGFLGTVVIMISCWLFMYWTATLILEAALQFDDEASFLTMARASLGTQGAIATWITFLLLFYSLVAAYLGGSGKIIIDALEWSVGLELPKIFNLLPLLVIFAPFIYFGLSFVDQLNRFLMFAMLASYLTITIWLLPKVSVDQLILVDWKFSLLSFSVVVTSFGYHAIIPSMVTYLERDVDKVKKCMFYGSLIPLLVYMLWEIAILGTIDIKGSNGLLNAFLTDQPLAKVLRYKLNSDIISVLAQCFSVFAIVTSFLGVAQGLFDFLKDAVKARRSHQRRTLAFILTFLPPVVFLLLFERGFIALLEYAGALVAIVLGIIPILIVWQLRKKTKQQISYRALGGPLSLIMGLLFFLFVVLLVVAKNLEFISFN